MKEKEKKEWLIFRGYSLKKLLVPELVLTRRVKLRISKFAAITTRTTEELG